jgi:capsular polysaccharide biosynthesis protein
MDAKENEIELMDYLDVLWKKKWLIILPTLFCVITAGLISIFIPPEWEIDIIIQPSKFLIKTEEGRFEEIIVVDPRQIAGQINQESYNHIIAAELNIDIKEFPELEAANIINTILVLVKIKNHDIEQAKLILNSLFNHLKAEIDKKADIEISGIDSEIKSNEIEKTRLAEEIKLIKNKLTIIRKRKSEIEDEMKEARERIVSLEKEQIATLRKQDKNEAETLGMLLYSNEIQESLRYHNTLKEILNNKKNQETDLLIEIDNRDKNIKKLENLIERLSERKGRIDFTELIKEPTISVEPVSPKTGLNVFIAGVLSFIIFTILTFFLDYIQKHKAKNR